MTLRLELSEDLERELSAEAARSGLPLSDYALHVLATRHRSASSIKTGAELVAFWTSEGLVGSRQEIPDAPAHARQLRRAAERRQRG